MANGAPRSGIEDKSLSRSGFEKKGGYPSSSTPVPVSALPRVPKGPAPGAVRPKPGTPSGSAAKSRKSGN